MSANDPVIRRSAERMLKLTNEEEAELYFGPHNETQSIVDHMERSIYDGDPNDWDDDFDPDA